MPSGLGTVLGARFGGRELSLGQWQRVATARGFMARSGVLIFDEPTAALDPLAEVRLFKDFLELAHGRTAVLVSHRLGGARLASRIVVLNKGRVIEVGTHDELVRAQGMYACLFKEQRKWYKEDLQL